MTAVERAEAARQGLQPQRTIVFVDEVHRFNKSQQDAFLPHVESGLFTFIGATTENPSFEVNSALLSRAAVYVLQPLQADDLRLLVTRAQGLGVVQDPVHAVAQPDLAPVRLQVDVGGAAAVASAVFTDAPGTNPGTRPASGVDTVEFTGAGRWNGVDGFRYVVVAQDRGEPGRRRDVVTITIVAPDGTAVLHATGTLDRGNIASRRVRR